jgi:hypothetical protein
MADLARLAVPPPLLIEHDLSPVGEAGEHRAAVARSAIPF